MKESGEPKSDKPDSYARSEASTCTPVDLKPAHKDRLIASAQTQLNSQSLAPIENEKHSQREFQLSDGRFARETSAQRTYAGSPVNLRQDEIANTTDRKVRREERASQTEAGNIGAWDEMGHKHASRWGAGIDETLVEAAGDRKNLSPQFAAMNRPLFKNADGHAESSWFNMESAVEQYRIAHPDSAITITVRERFIPASHGERAISRTIEIKLQDGTTPDELRHWTEEGNLTFSNPKG